MSMAFFSGADRRMCSMGMCSRPPSGEAIPLSMDRKITEYSIWHCLTVQRASNVPGEDMQQQRDKMPQKCTSEATGVFLSSNITPCTEYTSMLYVVHLSRHVCIGLWVCTLLYRVTHSEQKTISSSPPYQTSRVIPKIHSTAYYVFTVLYAVSMS